jgi:protein-disulfide isomerase
MAFLLFWPLLLLLAPLSAAADPFDAAERAAIRDTVRQLLREEPELVLEALEILRERQQQAEAERRRQALAANRELLERDPGAPVAGNPEGDVTLVEFFDYRCPYCRAIAPTVMGLAESDRGLRIVFREWPILSRESAFAARAALAARWQGRYVDLHMALMQLDELTPETVRSTARQLGLDLARLEADMQRPEVQKHLDDSERLTQALGISGTPAFVIGDHVVPGMADRATLEALIARAREAARTDQRSSTAGGG